MPAGILTRFGLARDYAFSVTGSGVWQFRIYTINRGHLEDCASAWLRGVYPLRVQHGFQIPAAWTIKETNQFVWIIGYDGPEEWEAKEATSGLDGHITPILKRLVDLVS